VSEHLDRALAALDVGLQSTDEVNCDDHVPDGACWRCRRRPTMKDSTSGVCATCRTILLADVPDLPPDAEPLAAQLLAGADSVRVVVESVNEGCRQVATMASRIVGQVTPALKALADEVRETAPTDDPQIRR
jgi:hypothetical protein